jgi:hypothetical protein
MMMMMMMMMMMIIIIIIIMYGRIKALRATGWQQVNWIHLAVDRDKWRPFVNTGMKFRVP